MRVAIVSIPVRDQEAAKRFYRDALGFEVVSDSAVGQERRRVVLSPPGGGAAIKLVTWFPTMPPGSVQGLVYEVDDIVALRQRLLDSRIRVSPIQRSPQGMLLAQLDDPDGNGIVLQQPDR